MIYLLSLAVFVLVLGFADERTGLKRHNYKSYVIIAGSVVALMMGLRTQYTGSTDTYMYMSFYKGITNYDNFMDYYNLHLADKDFIFSETGFYLFMWLLSRVFTDPQMMLVASAIFITYSVCHFIRDNTEDVPTALLLYVCLGLFTFNMNGIRQAMGMAVCLWGYSMAKKRKLIPFVLVTLLAMQFHKTAICYFPVYFLPIIKTSKANTFWYFCGMVVFILAMDWIVETFNAFAGEDYEVGLEADGGGFTVIAIYFVAILLTLFLHESLQDKDTRCQFYGLVLGFACYLGRFFSQQILERLSYYFFYFAIPLFPNVIKRLEEKEQVIVKTFLIVGAIAVFWYRVRSGSFASFRPYFVR